MSCPSDWIRCINNDSLPALWSTPSAIAREKDRRNGLLDLTTRSSKQTSQHETCHKKSKLLMHTRHSLGSSGRVLGYCAWRLEGPLQCLGFRQFLGPRDPHRFGERFRSFGLLGTCGRDRPSSGRRSRLYLWSDSECLLLCTYSD